MATVQSIVDLLVREGLALPPASIPPDVAASRVEGARPDEAAVEGDLAWLSPNAARQVERVRAFRGTLLIAPAAVSAGAGPEARGVVLSSPNPKLAFIRAAETFLGALARIEWPRGPAALAGDAVVGSEVQLGAGVVLGPGVVLEDGVVVGPNTCIAHTTVRRGARIGCNCTIGQPGFGYERAADGRYHRFPHLGRVAIHEDVEIGNNTCIDRGALGETVIGRGCKIDNLVHIAHNVVLGPDVVVIAHAMVAGSVTVGAGAWIAPSAAVLNQKTIGAGAVVGLGAVVVRSVDAGTTVVGNPARPLPGRS